MKCMHGNWHNSIGKWRICLNLDPTNQLQSITFAAIIACDINLTAQNVLTKYISTLPSSHVPVYQYHSCP